MTPGPGDPARSRSAALRAVTRMVAIRSARDAEVRLALVRLLLAGGNMIAAGSCWVWPSLVGQARFASAIVAVSAVILVVAAVELAVARWRYTPALGYLSSAGDSLSVVAFAASLHQGGLSHMDYSGEVCTVLAVSGAIRGTVPAALWTTGLAIATAIVGAYFRDTEPLTGAMRVLVVIGTGMFAVWMAALVQRARQRELGQEILPRFLPADVVERLHTDPEALVDAARTVRASIVFVDLRGFTALAEARAPGDAFALLNRVHGHLTAQVRAERGHVDKFLGDGMLAVFGAHGDADDHADRALRAALAVARLSAGELGEAVEVGVGAHSGDVITGLLGGAERLEPTVIGDAVNTASRIQQLTRDHRTPLLVSGDLLDGLRDAGLRAGLAPLGEIAIRGRHAPIALFRLRDGVG